jgi:inner membrane protein
VDTLTHAALGAVVAHAATPRAQRLAARERLALGAIAAAFPDLDFAAFPLDPLAFLADWHQAPTHSLVLAPLWAAAIAGAFVALTKRRAAFAQASLVAALGLASHIAADAITAYGTALFYPLSSWRLGLGTVFVIDPIFTSIMLAALVAALRGAPPRAAAIGLAALAGYIALAAAAQRQALEIGRAAARAHGIAVDELAAFAQPLSPFHWKLIGAAGENYAEAYVNVAGHPPPMPAAVPWLGPLAAAYHAPARLRWRERHRFGESADLRALARERFEDPRFAAFRHFAAYPAVSRIDAGERETCVWFTDLRYDLPAFPDTFRYGFCRAGGAPAWQLYRLRYFTEDGRQRLRQ